MTQTPSVTRTQTQGAGTYDVYDFFYSSAPGAQFTNYTITATATSGEFRDPARLQDDRQVNPPASGQDGNTAGAVDTWANTVMSSAAKVDGGFSATILPDPAGYIPAGSFPSLPITFLKWDVFDNVQFDDNNLNDHPDGPFTAAAPYHLVRLVATQGTMGSVLFEAYDTSQPGEEFAYNFIFPGEGFLTRVDDAEIDDVNASDPGVVEHTFTTTGAPPVGWTNFGLVSYTPNYGAPSDAPGAAAAANAMFNPDDQKVSWTSLGAPRGDYVWQVQVVDGFGPGHIGTLTVHVTQVPEPASTVLCGLTMLCVFNLTRRRKVAGAT